MTSKIVGAENAFCIPHSREKAWLCQQETKYSILCRKGWGLLVNLEIKSVKEWKLSKHKEVQLSAAFS